MDSAVVGFDLPTSWGHGDTCVVVPAYNEAETVGDVVARLRENFRFVVCVDDGSCDETGLQAELAGATVLRHRSNLGQGAALQTGIRFALKHDFITYIITFDSDGQHHAEDADALLVAVKQGGFDVGLASRFKGTAVSMPLSRAVVLRLGILFTRLTTGLPLTDTHNGLRVLTRVVATTLNIRLHRMAHASEILHHIAAGNHRLIELPSTVTYSPRSIRNGQSSVNAVNILFDLLVDRLRVAR